MATYPNNKMMRLIFVMVMTGFSAPAWAQPTDPYANIRGTWHFSWSGIPFAKLWIALEPDTTPADHKLTATFKSSGLVRIFKKMKSYSTGQVVQRGGQFHTHHFHYENRRENKQTDLGFDNTGALILRNVQPEDDPWHRAPIDPQKLTNVSTPADLLWDLRTHMHTMLAAKQSQFTADFYEGKRLMHITANYQGETLYKIKGKTLPTHRLQLSRTLTDGFSDKEIRRYNEGEPTVHLYVRQSDFWPIAMEVDVKFGTLKAHWEAE